MEVLSKKPHNSRERRPDHMARRKEKKLEKKKEERKEERKEMRKGKR